MRYLIHVNQGWLHRCVTCAGPPCSGGPQTLMCYSCPLLILGFVFCGEVQWDNGVRAKDLEPRPTNGPAFHHLPASLGWILCYPLTTFWCFNPPGLPLYILTPVPLSLLPSTPSEAWAQMWGMSRSGMCLIAFQGEGRWWPSPSWISSTRYIQPLTYPGSPYWSCLSVKAIIY